MKKSDEPNTKEKNIATALRNDGVHHERDYIDH